MLIIVSYLPWIILDSWKSKTSANCFVQLVLLDFQSQILTSHAVFNCRAYTQRVDQIIPCTSSSFSIRDVASRSTLPTPHALRSNTFNNCSEANLTKTGFGSGGHCFAIATRWFHSHSALARARLATLIISPLHSHGISQDASIHLGMVLMSRTSCRSWRPPRFGLFCHQAMHLFQMLGQQPFGIVCDSASANFALPFRPNLRPFLVFPSQIKWTKKCKWLRRLFNFQFWT